MKCLQNALRLLSTNEQITKLIHQFSDHEIIKLFFDWPIWARDNQSPDQSNWVTWMLLGGRGSGKTRAGAEWIRAMVYGRTPLSDVGIKRIALVGETYGDVRDVMIEGESGLLAIHPINERPKWITSKRQLIWPTGAVAHVYSSEEPDGLRGPQFEIAWCDELAKWQNLDATWDMLQFAMRLGTQPRMVVTTTPRPLPLIKRLVSDETTLLSHSSTKDNQRYLAAGFYERLVGQYKGSRLARQELEGEIVDELNDALWSREILQTYRIEFAPKLKKIIVAVDPAVTAHEKSDACGIIAVGLGHDDRGYVLADSTLKCASPSKWSECVIALYRELQADAIVVEVNQGGDMVQTILRTLDKNLPIKNVRASKSKWLRAEPIALLYEQGRVSHVGNFDKLEDEMCTFTREGFTKNVSPDRMDAMVWGLHELMLGKTKMPRIRHA